MWPSDRESAAEFTNHYQQMPGKVRLELVRRHIAHELHPGTMRMVDLGSGGANQSIEFIKMGHHVTMVEPSALMMGEAKRNLERHAASSELYRLIECDALADDSRLANGAYDVVMCHGVAMYYESSEPFIATMARLAKPGALVSFLTKSSLALAMRPGMQGDWDTAIQSFDQAGSRGWLGQRTRGDTPAEVKASMARHNVTMQDWYGVGVFTDHYLGSLQVPDSSRKVVEAEWLASRRDPYRRVARLIHVIGRRSETDDG